MIVSNLYKMMVGHDTSMSDFMYTEPKEEKPMSDEDKAIRHAAIGNVLRAVSVRKEPN